MTQESGQNYLLMQKIFEAGELVAICQKNGTMKKYCYGVNANDFAKKKQKLTLCI